MNPQDNDQTRIFVAIFAAALLLIFWQATVEAPRRAELAKLAAVEQRKQAITHAKEAARMAVKAASEDAGAPKTHAERLAASPRIKVASEHLHGSIALRGARFDDLTLARYRLEQDPKSPEVTLFAPSGDANAYFAHAGWLAADGTTKVPDSKTLWTADKQTLGAGDTVNLRWDNGAGQLFVLSVSLDKDYMFSIAQRVENKSAASISVTPYAYLNRAHKEESSSYAISHEGPLGVVDGVLTEIGYKELREKGNKEFPAANWVSMSDKYWIAAIIPGGAQQKVNFSHYSKDEQDRYQVDYMGAVQDVAAGGTAEAKTRLFAGAKEIDVLDAYTLGDSNNAPITLFDRAVDFGWLYFLTKPLFLLLNFFYSHVGNFGIAIMSLTIVVKLCMYPLANKAFIATAQMRDLQPEMAKLKERCGDDKMKYNQEVMAMYKREKVSPASGCLPVLVQMPVFFALYKVFFVTIEMRHAPFYGWLKDLSVMDPSNLFTAFGLIDWQPWFGLHLGLLPLLMGITMFIQMKLQPKPADPVQAQMMNIMPFMFLFMFASFPAGLVLYWVWSNTLSIIQQRVITYRYHKVLAAQGKKPGSHIDFASVP
ncbi:MAG: membrane protein insertase YidC [Alphaproteobacteria bacterium]|nr:membrane protein insertase YidC [Alphaproteobacteria bacterium]